ncbi:MAG: hypothetical protein JO112_18730 [Planctomycetes bacterium]|nr:hypothetical protein [Planctomycetota bacterium]
MKRNFLAAVLTALGLSAVWSAGPARAQYPPDCPPNGVGPAPFAGASYAFVPPGYVANSLYQSYYLPSYTSYYNPGYSASPEGPVYHRDYYPNPGPYYYTPGYSYTPGYYSYYYTPGYFRY